MVRRILFLGCIAMHLYAMENPRDTHNSSRFDTQKTKNEIWQKLEKIQNGDSLPRELRLGDNCKVISAIYNKQFIESKKLNNHILEFMVAQDAKLKLVTVEACVSVDSRFDSVENFDVITTDLEEETSSDTLVWGFNRSSARKGKIPALSAEIKNTDISRFS